MNRVSWSGYTIWVRPRNRRGSGFDPKQAIEFVAFAYLILSGKAADADPEKCFKAVINALLEVSLINDDREKIDMIPIENKERIQDAMFRII
jgi:hypothetical protein